MNPMKQLNRVIALALVLLLTLSVLPTIFVGAENIMGYPGETVKVKIVVEDVISLDGEVTVTAGSEIVESIDCAVVNRGGLKGGVVTGNTVFLYSTAANPTPGDVTLEITVNLTAGAKVGEQCTLTLTYYKSEDPSGMTMGPKSEKGAVVTVQAKPVSTDPTTGTEDNKDPTTQATKPTTGTNTNTNTNTKPGTSTNNNSTTKPGTTTNNNSNTNSTTPTTATEPNNKMDYAELKKQIGIAKGLKKSDYDDAAWSELTKALENAEKLTTSEDQYQVDQAAKALEAAIAKLVGVDHTKLREALDSVAEYSQDLELSSLWYQMIGVLENAEDKLTSSDQAEVDAAAAQLEDLLMEIAKAEQEAGSGTIIQEVPVPVLPTDDYCNITVHNVWPMLFFISLALNLAMAAVIVIYIMRIQKTRMDDTPLVDYDIDDDLYLDDVYLDDMESIMNEMNLADEANLMDETDLTDEMDLVEEDLDLEDLDFDNLDLDALDLDFDALDLDSLDLDSLDLDDDEDLYDLDLEELDLEALGLSAE